jgi:hypothetical protein
MDGALKQIKTELKTFSETCCSEEDVEDEA